MFFSFKIHLFFIIFSAFLITSAQAIPAMTRSNLNFRNGAGTQHNIQLVIPAFTLIEVRECKDTWCLIEFNNKVGWVSKAFLAFSNDKTVSQNNTMKPDLGHYWQDDWYWKRKN